MPQTVNLNADLGESFGAWEMGSDAEMLATVNSANVACGFHAGDPLVMRRTLSLARKAGQIVTGATKVKAAIEGGEVVGLFTASDAAADAGPASRTMENAAPTTSETARQSRRRWLSERSSGMEAGLSPLRSR